LVTLRSNYESLDIERRNTNYGEKEMILDITMTACRRSEIVDRTLDSFCKKMFNKLNPLDVRLVVNIDPIGTDKDSNAVFEVCKRYFKTVLANFPKTPDFPKAFKWCWLNTVNEFVFHLEDDWELLLDVDINDMIALMEETPSLAYLRLPRWRTDESACKNWGHWFPWNGKYFQCPKNERSYLGFSGHPALILGEFVSKTAPLLIEGRNPEKQFHYQPLIVKVVNSYDFGVYARQNQPPAILEIGEKWRLQHGFTKGKDKAFFTRWEMENGENSVENKRF